jgi:polygalacturonase
MKMKNNGAGKNDRIDRRSIVKNGSALIGAGFLSSFVTPSVEPSEKVINNIFNVRDFGATGKRADNATIPVCSAIDACFAAGGGKVYVPPGDYTVITMVFTEPIQLIFRISEVLGSSKKNKRSILTSCAVWYPQRT